MKLLETLRVLPQPGTSRFGTIALGFDRVTTVRDEHVALRAFAAMVCGVDPEQLTLEAISAFNARVSAVRTLAEDPTALGLRERAFDALTQNDFASAVAFVLVLNEKAVRT
ncbi:MAG: hypothetical protein IMZ71_01550 [Chloroflexi bacterium]|nr:hypothetical protein [Chloroflexota bacterium]